MGRFFWSSCDTLESENSFLDVHDEANPCSDEDVDELRVFDITSVVRDEVLVEWDTVVIANNMSSVKFYAA